ncbi:MAG: methylenetetrahydrofolate reductase [Haloechinothrix sp.]
MTSTARAVTAVQVPAQALATALRHLRYEVLPLAGTEDLVVRHVPRDLPVTVTVSPRRGLEPTIALTEALCRRGFRAVPHLAARLIVDDAHLADLLRRLDQAAVTDAFVVAGDVERPVGVFADSLTLLRSMHRLRQSGAGHRLEQVGVAGYPEGHPLVSTGQLAEAVLAKQAMATYVVSQMCFDAAVISAWVTRIRGQGVSLPVHIGIAGVVDRRKLLRVAGRIGLGPSARFLRKHRHGLVRLLQPGGYRPDHLVRQLSAEMAQPERGIAGLHVYTLGDLASTEQWRGQALDRLGEMR